MTPHWFLKYNLSYKDAARCLRDWGVSFVLAQSRLLFMPDSAVKSDVEPEQLAGYSRYDDRKFRDALAYEGIVKWPTRTFFSPQTINENSSLRPIGSDGLPMEQIDWYIGIAPTAESFVAKQISAIEHAIRELEPEGVLISFARWPGFWELWMPDHTRHDFPEYSFDQHTLERFMQDTGTNLPNSLPRRNSHLDPRQGT